MGEGPTVCVLISYFSGSVKGGGCCTTTACIQRWNLLDEASAEATSRWAGCGYRYRQSASGRQVCVGCLFVRSERAAVRRAPFFRPPAVRACTYSSTTVVPRSPRCLFASSLEMTGTGSRSGVRRASCVSSNTRRDTCRAPRSESSAYMPDRKGSNQRRQAWFFCLLVPRRPHPRTLYLFFSPAVAFLSVPCGFSRLFLKINNRSKTEPTPH